VTQNPLGVLRKERTDEATEVTPEEHANVLSLAADWMRLPAPLSARLFDVNDDYLKEDESL
jgi:hypothetical protein